MVLLLHVTVAVPVFVPEAVSDLLAPLLVMPLGAEQALPPWLQFTA